MIRNILRFWPVLAVATCLGAAPLKAQDVPARPPITQTRVPTAATVGPRAAPRFQVVQPVLQDKAPKPLAHVSGQHTIVVSTLALVLGVIVIVLLVA